MDASTKQQLRTQAQSPYMEWAKLCSTARFNLATSGIDSYPLAELPVEMKDLEINGPTGYGYEPLQQRLAAKCGVSAESVVLAVGTSLANNLALAGTTEHGDEILMEHPAYEPMASTASFLGLEVRSFERRFGDGFRIDPREVERRMTPRTRLIVITNLHNPSGALTDEATLLQLAEIARAHNALVLVDEVYLELGFDHAPRSAFHLSPRDFVITSSLTKGYGLSGVRCGWILADPDLARRIWHINDLYGSTFAHPAERLSVIALENLERVAKRARAIVEKNRPLLDLLLDAQEGKTLDVVRPPFGTVCFPRLRRGNVAEFCKLLREKYETTVVPGEFFAMPQHFRVGIGGNPEMTAEGLKRLGAALDQYTA